MATLNIAVCPRQITEAHEQQDWYDAHGPRGSSIDGMGVGPSIFRRDASTTRDHVPDGWVLNIGNGDEWIIGQCIGDEDSAPEQALAEASLPAQLLRRSLRRT